MAKKTRKRTPQGFVKFGRHRLLETCGGRFVDQHGKIFKRIFKDGKQVFLPVAAARENNT